MAEKTYKVVKELPNGLVLQDVTPDEPPVIVGSGGIYSNDDGTESDYSKIQTIKEKISKSVTAGGDTGYYDVVDPDKLAEYLYSIQNSN